MRYTITQWLILLFGLLYNEPNSMDVVYVVVAFTKPCLLQWLEIVNSNDKASRDEPEELIDVAQK